MLYSALHCTAEWYYIGVVGTAAIPKPYIRSGVGTMANKPKQKFEIVGDEIVVRYKLAPYLSKSEKSYVIGTSHGRDTFPWEGKNVHINFNAYVMKEEWEGK